MDGENKQTVAPASGVTNETPMATPTAAPTNGNTPTCTKGADTCCPTEVCKNVCAAISNATGTDCCSSPTCQYVCGKYAQLRAVHPYVLTACDYMEVLAVFIYTHVVVHLLALLAPYQETHITPALHYATEKFNAVATTATETYKSGSEMVGATVTKARETGAVAVESFNKHFPQVQAMYNEHAKAYVDMAVARLSEAQAAVMQAKPKTE